MKTYLCLFTSLFCLMAGAQPSGIMDNWATRVATPIVYSNNIDPASWQQATNAGGDVTTAQLVSATNNLDAAKAVVGTLPLARLSGITSNQLDAQTWLQATNDQAGGDVTSAELISATNNLDAAKLVAGTVALARLGLSQPGDADLTNWASVAVSAVQPASANLTNWSSLAVAAVQPADTDLTNWAQLSTNLLMTNINIDLGPGFAGTYISNEFQFPTNVTMYATNLVSNQIVGPLTNPINSSGVITGLTVTASSGFYGNGLNITNVPLAGLRTNGATSGQVVKFDGTAWAPGTDSGEAAGFQWGSQNLTNWSSVATNAVTNLFPAGLTNAINTSGSVTSSVALGAPIVRGYNGAWYIDAAGLGRFDTIDAALVGNALNGVNLTNVQTANVDFGDDAAFPSVTNAFTLGNAYVLLQASGNCSVTNIYGSAHGKWGTLVVSNSAAGNITNFITAAKRLVGSNSTNALVIPSGKVGVISCLYVGNGITNVCTAVEQ